MPRTMQLVTFSLCVASAVALPTAPPTSVPKTVTAPRIPSASFLTALATQPALGNETMSVLMATMMANHEARPAGRHLQADPKSDAELMKSAVEAAKLTIGTIKDAVTGLVQQVDTVNEEIKDLNATQMLGIDPATVAKLTSNAAYASIHLSHVTTDAHNIYKSMLDLTGVTIQTLQMGMKAGASDATKVSAVKGAMTLFAASAQSSAQQLEALKEKVRTIAKAKELCATMLTIATELNEAAIFVKSMPDPEFWSMTLRELEELTTDLQKAYDAGQPSAAAPPSPSPAPQ